MKDRKPIGVISDTHGLLRPKAVEILSGCSSIIHAGDLGSLDVLEELRRIAPLTVVRGNVDRGTWANELPEWTICTAGPSRAFVLHDVALLDTTLAAGCDVVIFGHSHRAFNEMRGNVLYLNPGSIGPKRFELPVTMALLHEEEGGLRAEMLTLE